MMTITIDINGATVGVFTVRNIAHDDVHDDGCADPMGYDYTEAIPVYRCAQHGGDCDGCVTCSEQHGCVCFK